MYGDEHLSAGEIDLLHTPMLQRLYDLHQLGLTDRVFIDASHSRLHHVVGVLEQTEKLIDAIIRNLRANPERELFYQSERPKSGDFADRVRDARPVIRLIGLLHDLTHAPFGHTIEDEIRLVASKHDHPERQSEAFYRLVCQYLGWLALEAGVRPTNSNEKNAADPEMPAELWQHLLNPASSMPKAALTDVAAMSVALLSNPSEQALAAWKRSHARNDAIDDIAQFLAQLAEAMRALLYLDVLHAEEISAEQCPSEAPYAFEQLIHAVLEGLNRAHLREKYRFDKHRDAYMLDIIGNTVCADLLDYAQRDSHFAGIKLGYDSDRIAENFTLVSWELGLKGRRLKEGEDPKITKDPFPGRSIRTAISLYSHKLRTDVPSELMNLLNVRYYIYERALFHPTKCAAGAMLGTGLQLMGWRPLRDEETVKDYELPSEFRNIGDTVFLNDLIVASRTAVHLLGQHTTDSKVDIERLKQDLGSSAHSPQTRIAELILDRWDGLSRSDAEESVRAGLELLIRVTARRFYRPVFRNLPNARNTLLTKIGSDQIAETFKNPITRFDTERKIERIAGLRSGSVVIHCPVRSGAQKIANVLLVIPTEDGLAESPEKLRDIGRIDQEVFGAHQDAIKAVEKMYKSMWRLIVCVAPEYLADFEAISSSAGRVIFEALDHYKIHPKTATWDSDKYLMKELGQKYGSTTPPLVARQLVLHGADKRGRRASAETAVELRDTYGEFILICRGYLGTRSKTKMQRFEQWYEERLSTFDESSADLFLAELKESVAGTIRVDTNKPTPDGELSSQLLRFLDDLVTKYGREA
jgi:HD superfamily phosphohydrolase